MDPVLGNPVDWIVRAFADIAASNEAVVNRKISPSNYEKLELLIRTGRQSFQALCNVAAIGCGGRKGKGKRKAKGVHPAARRVRSLRSTTTPSSLTTTAYNSQESDLSDALNIHAGQGSATLAGGFDEELATAEAFERLIRLPNIHTGLHHLRTAQYLATPANALVLIEEDKHRYFKGLVAQTNKRDMNRVLLAHENFQQSIRFASTTQQPGGTDVVKALASQLVRLKQSCPQLLSAMLPPSHTYNAEELAEEEAVVGDEEHRDIKLYDPISAAYAEPKVKIFPPTLAFRNLPNSSLRVCPLTMERILSMSWEALLSSIFRSSPSRHLDLRDVFLS